MFSVFLLAAFSQLAPDILESANIDILLFFTWLCDNVLTKKVAAMVLGLDCRNSMIYCMNHCSTIGSYKVNFLVMPIVVKVYR